MPIYHLVARTLPGQLAFADRDQYAHFWDQLRDRFDSTLGCALMPDHAHLLLSTSRPERIKSRFAIELRAYARQRGQPLWMRVPPPALIPNDLHLKRTIRYIHLNPCRDRLVRDPLEWEWSTHRDAMGAVHLPWLDPIVVERLFRGRENFHQYVAADPSVAISGTPPPLLRPPSEMHGIGVETLLNAALLTTRSSSAQLLRLGTARELAIHLARGLPQQQRQAVAARLGLHLRTLYAHWQQPIPPALAEAAQLTLSDPRLLLRVSHSKQHS